ncbi:MAG: hypothetical protein Q9165_005906 [Trypethelium subeluteriae]
MPFAECFPKTGARYPTIPMVRRDGLYGGLMIQHGNNVGETFAVKTRRTWHPNIQPHSLYSRALGRPIRLRVATRVLRTIDKVGGLDEYLVGSNTSARIRELGVTGWALRWRVLQTEVMRKRFGIRKRERDWLGQARRLRTLDGLEEEEELEGADKREFNQGNALQERVEAVGELELDKETKREVEAFDRVLDEEDHKAIVEAQEEQGTLAREGQRRVRGAVESEDSDKVDNEGDLEMIQQRRGVMDRVRGLFGRKR